MCVNPYSRSYNFISFADLSQAVDPDSEAVHATSHASPVVSVPTESSTPLSLQPGTHKKSPKHPSAMRSGEVVTLSQTSQGTINLCIL